MKKVRKAALCAALFWVVLTAAEGIRLVGSTDPERAPLLDLGGTQAEDCCAEYISLGFVQDYHLGEDGRFVSGQFRVLGFPVARWDYTESRMPDCVRVSLQQIQGQEGWMESRDGQVISTLLQLRRQARVQETSRPCETPRYLITFMQGGQELERWYLSGTGVTSGDYFGLGNRQLQDTGAYEEVGRLLREKEWTGMLICD